MKRKYQPVSLIACLSVTLFLFMGCNHGIKKFQPADLNTGGVKYSPLFSKEINPLKSEWKELYLYLRQGHILHGKEAEEVKYIYSHLFYKFIKKNLLRVYDTPYLNQYENFIKVFGAPEEEKHLNNKIIINYVPTIIGDPCQSCQHDAFGYTFDANTRKLLKE